MLRHPPFLLRLGICAWVVCCVEVHAAPPVIPETVKSRIRQRVDYGYNPSVIVGMVNADGRTYFSYGRRVLETESPVDEHTIYEIGSVTKVFTSVLLADAVSRGEVQLNQQVQSVVSDDFPIPLGSPEISLVHLATHRSGLPANPANLCLTGDYRLFECYTERHLRDFLGGYSLPRKPGATWDYSNLGFGLLGFALSQQLGASYGDLLQERVLDPLGLEDTTLSVDSSQAFRTASGYSGPQVRPPFHMGVLAGAGELRSTASDMLRFLEFNLRLQTNGMNGTLDGMRQQRGSTALSGVQQGLGWWLADLPGGRVVQHGGNTFGHSAFIGFHPTKRLGVVVLSNARVNSAADIVDLGYHLLDANYPLTTLRRPAVVSLEDMQRLVGTYQAESRDVFRVRLELGQLVIEHPASRLDFPAYPFTATRFEALAAELPAGTTANFQIVNGANRARSMVWTQSGVVSTYIRQADPNQLNCIVQGNVAILSLVGGDEAEYSVESSTDLIRWESMGTLPGLGRTLEVPVSEGPSTVFFRSMRTSPASSPLPSGEFKKLRVRSEPILTPSAPDFPR